MAANNRSASAQLAETSTEPNIKQVVLGNIQFKTWFRSLYPEKIVGKEAEQLYVCGWCFRYTCDESLYIGHTRLCEHRSVPAGIKIYDHSGFSVWEIDGEEYKLLTQNLSLFAKLFLDHKSVFFDVSSFVYYVLVYTDPTVQHPKGYNILGYFSKEKLSWDQNNLACILIFPPYQHKQLGQMLMGISYKLSAWEWEEGTIGGPEKPLSEMGRKSYVRFWQERIARYLLLGPPADASRDRVIAKPGGVKGSRKKPARERMTVREIGNATGMLVEDVITALKEMGVVEVKTTNNKRKKADSGDDADHALDEAVVRKQSVREWVKRHNVNLQDPVREEGFLGEWAPEDFLEAQQKEQEE